MFGGAGGGLRPVRRPVQPQPRASDVRGGSQSVPGHRALDVGCGSGALVALSRTSSADDVAGVDPSEPFSEAARAKVPGAGSSSARRSRSPSTTTSSTRRSRSSSSTFSTIRIRRARDGARHPSGRSRAGCVWDYADGMTMLQTFWDSASALDPRAQSRGWSNEMRFSRRAGARRLSGDAGLSGVAVSPITSTPSYDDFDDLWAPFPTGVGPAGAFTASLDAESQSVCARSSSAGSAAGRPVHAARAGLVRRRPGLGKQRA